MIRADSAPQRPPRNWTPEEKLSAIHAALKDLRMDAALDILRSLMTENPSLGDGWRDVVNAAIKTGDPWSTLEAQRRYVAADPNDPERHERLIPLLLGFGQLDEAQALAEKLSRQGETDTLTMQLATVALFKGESERAGALFRKTLALNPEMFEAWRRLALLERFEADDPEVEEMKALEKRLEAEGKPLARTGVLFALGSVHERLGDYDASYRHFSEAQALGAEARDYSIHDEADFTDRIIEVFNERFFAGVRRAGEGARSDRPIFIFGMPRSGTTLVEQILTNHSDVADGGELEALRLAGYPLGHYGSEALKRFVITYGRSRDPGGAFGRIGNRYLMLLAEQFGGEGRIVDKALELPFMAGTAIAALPSASYVWMRRDPRDVALSVFKTPFPQRHDWTWSWERIAHRLIHVQALQRHYSKLFPDTIRVQRYEDLAQEPAGETAAILNHCRLSPEAVHEDAHKSGRSVMTASTLQVREPISTKSIGAWKRYEPHMRPFFEAFEKAWPKEWGDPYVHAAS